MTPQEAEEAMAAAAEELATEQEVEDPQSPGTASNA